MITAQQAEELERRIAEIAEAEVAARVTDQSVVLAGLVESEEQRQAVEDVAREMYPDVRIENEVEVAELDLPASGEATNPIEVARPSPLITALSDDDQTAEPVFPPTDPVVDVNEDGDVEVLGGFSPTSMDDVDLVPSTTGPGPGDEALAEAVIRELREDAATTDLELDVRVVGGVVHITGRVPGVVDAENAESVAGRVPGVRDVVDETELVSDGP